MEQGAFLAVFPSGIPVVTGHFGTATHAPEVRPRQHFSTDWDLLFIKKGGAAFQLKSNRVLKVPVDHFFLLPPYTPAWLQPHRSVLRQCFLHFSFYPTPPGVFSSVQNDCLVAGRKIFIPCVFSKKEAPKVWRSYRDLMAINLSTNGPPWRMACALSRLVSELGAFALGLDLSPAPALAEDAEAMDPRIAELCRRISENPGFPWKIPELAKSVGLSVGYLDRLWYSNVGVNIKRYVIEMRLQHASQLLLDQSGKSPRSIKEIGNLCGFASQQFFSRQFKKYLSSSPSRYRYVVSKTARDPQSWLVNRQALS
jgi:AraC-like DNA-binding protein